MTKCIVIFVEGETEIEFYKRFIEYTRNKIEGHRLQTRIELVNVHGVGGFKNVALRKFFDIKQQYDKKCCFTVAFCRDTDVFELSQKPPVNWVNLEKEFKAQKIKEVIHVKAIHSIEDWFLYDVDSIIRFLRLPQNTKVSGKNGYDKLKKLYKMANKIYFKGSKSNGMVARLNLEKIIKNVKLELEPLYKILEAK